MCEGKKTTSSTKPIYSYILLAQMIYYSDSHKIIMLSGGGFLERQNTETGQFSRRNSEKLCIFWWISKIGILADTEFFYFVRYLTDILK